MPAYYNDSDRFCCAWLRELIKAGHIPPGDVDERPIQEVRGSDLEGYDQVHLFAGIGGWAYAFRLAEWPADEPVWTGSCPCQPYSQAGKGEGDDDPRNLWPQFRRLIAECGPSVVFGEQVASKAGRLWLAGVRADLEALGYAVGAADLCAAGVAAPHIRQRLWWVADATSRGGANEQACFDTRGSLERAIPGTSSGTCGGEAAPRTRRSRTDGGESGVACGLAEPRSLRQPQHPERDGEQKDDSSDRNPQGPRADGHGDDCGMGHAIDNGPQGLEQAGAAAGAVDGARASRGMGDADLGGEETLDRIRPGSCTKRPGGPWGDFDLVPCADGKARRVESGTFPLAHGVPGRVGRLRGYGNAIVPQVAAEFIRAWRGA